MADYIIYITDLDETNVNSENKGDVLHGFTDNIYNLDQKTYDTVRRGRYLSTGAWFNIPVSQVWEDNIQKINDAITTEINKQQQLLLIDKATLYELIYFDPSFKVIPQNEIDYYVAEIQRRTDLIEYLENYQP
jgi:hypothetical protein